MEIFQPEVQPGIRARNEAFLYAQVLIDSRRKRLDFDF